MAEIKSSLVKNHCSRVPVMLWKAEEAELSIQWSRRVSFPEYSTILAAAHKANFS
jgi:hypothetical protein